MPDGAQEAPHPQRELGLIKKKCKVGGGDPQLPSFLHPHKKLSPKAVTKAARREPWADALEESPRTRIPSISPSTPWGVRCRKRKGQLRAEPVQEPGLLSPGAVPFHPHLRTKGQEQQHKHLLRDCHVSGAILSTLYRLTHLTLSTTPRDPELSSRAFYK